MSLLPLTRVPREESVVAPLDASRQAASQNRRFRSRLEAAFSQTGLLALLCIFSILGGLLVQHGRSDLPAAYTWLQPMRTLKQVVLTVNFPILAALAYLLGLLSRLGVSACRDRLWTMLDWSAQPRLALLRASAFFFVSAADILLVPKHGLLDALALGCMGVLVSRPWSKAELCQALLHAALVAVSFIAVCYWFTVVKALTFVGAEQKDAQILRFEQAVFGVVPHRWISAWAAQNPSWVHWFDRVYFRIFEHMALTTFFLIGAGNVRARTEYVGALAICYFLGAPLYLAFPAAGPVYFDPNTFRFLQQQELIVNQVQAALFRNTAAVNDGRASVLQTWSYIACMPSLHMAHETVMLYVVRRSKPALLISLAFTAVTSVAVVALGWHYPSDLLAGFALGALALVLARWQSGRLLPARLIQTACPAPDEETVCG
jgi:membrane-associated phospholipid phosphatase